MAYLEKHAPLKTNPQLIQEGGQKGIIMLSINYFQARRDLKKHWQPQIHVPNHKEGQVARYAFGRDYHKVFKSKLKQLAKLINEHFPDSQTRFFADSGPLLERQYAEFSGLGYIGKNCLLITRSHGSWVLLEELITTLDIPADEPFDRETMQCRHGRIATNAKSPAQPVSLTSVQTTTKSPDASKYVSCEPNAPSQSNTKASSHRSPCPTSVQKSATGFLAATSAKKQIIIFCPHNIRAKQTTLPDFPNKYKPSPIAVCNSQLKYSYIWKNLK